MWAVAEYKIHLVVILIPFLVDPFILDGTQQPNESEMAL